MTTALYPPRRELVESRQPVAGRQLAAGRWPRPRQLTGRGGALTHLLGVAVAGLAAWIVVLAVGLSAGHSPSRWRLLWLGFDTLELVALAVTLWAVYRSRHLAIPAALVTGTLLACDAWFDVVLSWDSRGWWFSVATAVLVELPLAAVLWGSAGSMIRAVVATQGHGVGPCA